MEGGARKMRCARLWRAQAGAAGLLLVALQGPGCATGAVLEAGRFVHRERGYAIDPPGGSWSRVEVEGADLAFRTREHASMSLLSRCSVPLAEPRVLVRHLAIGLEQRELLAEGPVEVAGSPGWFQTWRARSSAVPVQLKFVSLVAGRCVFDWVLVARAGFETLEAEFDAWRGSFRLSPPAGAPAAQGPR